MAIDATEPDGVLHVGVANVLMAGNAGPTLASHIKIGLGEQFNLLVTGRKGKPSGSRPMRVRHPVIRSVVPGDRMSRSLSLCMRSEGGPD